ncbi:MAG TPA: hypothetical protein V6D47_21660 [Oscillatoriaceae cyanobacterium]
MLRRLLVPASLLPLVLQAPAQAAGVGYALPSFRVLTVGQALSLGASVQVIGTTFQISDVAAQAGLDYAYTRDFSASTNYAFFDLTVGAGVPLGFTPQFYVTPALDLHSLFFVSSPENLNTPAFGIAPRLSFGFRPARALAIELGLSQAFLLNLASKSQPHSGGLTTVQLSGTYSF